MTVSVVAMVLSILLSGAALFAGYTAGGMPEAARWLSVTPFLWLLAHWQRWNWLGSTILLVVIAAAAVGMWLGLLPGLMLAAAVAALLGWDLSGFVRRIRLASPTDDVRGIERRHLLRVGIVAFISSALAAFSLFVHVRVPFEVAVLLMLVAAVGLTRLAAWLQHENEL